ncbi:hypothetical protein AD952_04755 [Acetobacter cerevisiae]|uniref:Uncharacterized protein n=1 Tax=Acetobacter cerevisiae TaxID=178900 RepID=A0A149UWL3_9PROT|nr:hypothetical protein AD952_04755 [Acetobacter cerevisiae]
MTPNRVVRAVFYGPLSGWPPVWHQAQKKPRNCFRGFFLNKHKTLPVRDRQSCPLLAGHHVQGGVVHDEHGADEQNHDETNSEEETHVVPTLFRPTAHVQEVVQVHEHLNEGENRKTRQRT